MSDHLTRHRPRPRRSIAAISAALALMVVCAVRPAWAQNASAEALFDEGNKAMSAGQIAQACDLFEASNRAEARAGTLIRLGECREQNHQLASAWSAYKDALGRAKDPRKRTIASAKVAELEPRLSHLTVSVAEDARLPDLALTRDGKVIDALTLGRALPVDGGDYRIAAHASGHEDFETVAHVPVEGGKVTVEIPKLHEAAVATVTPPPAPVTPQVVSAPVSPAAAAVAPVAVSAPPGGLTSRRKLALGVGGVAVVSGTLGVVFGLSSRSNQDSAFTTCNQNAPTACSNPTLANSQLDTARSRALDADIAYAVAGVLAVGAGVLWWTGGRGEGVGVAPSVAPGRAGLSVVGAF